MGRLCFSCNKEIIIGKSMCASSISIQSISYYLGPMILKTSCMQFHFRYRENLFTTSSNFLNKYSLYLYNKQ